MFVRTKTRGGYTYLMVVENSRVGGRVQQRVLQNLGRLDVLQDTGRLDALFHSLGRFASGLDVLGAHERGESITTRTARIGPDLIFGRLWSALHIDGVLKNFLSERKFEFEIERAVLGAVGEGDIGQLFPNTDPQWRGAPSRLFLEEAARRVTARGARIVNVDASLIAQAPKMAPPTTPPTAPMELTAPRVNSLLPVRARIIG
jgi:hypothetical protein